MSEFGSDENAHDNLTANEVEEKAQKEKERDSKVKAEENSHLRDDSTSRGDEIDEVQFFQRLKTLPNLVSQHSVLSLGLKEIQAETSSFQSLKPALTYRTIMSPKQEFLDPHSSIAPPATQMSCQDTSETTPRSPRTNRLNTLATEMSEPLRRNLLWERQSKLTTIYAFCKANQARSAMESGSTSLPPCS